MYQLTVPAFKFVLYTVDQNQNNKFKNNIQNNNIICYADAYEVEEGGAITFYRTGYRMSDSQKKKIKIPVLSYPSGKWEACLLLDKNDTPYVSSSSGEVIDTPISSGNLHNHSSHKSHSTKSSSEDNNDNMEDELEALSQNHHQGGTRSSTTHPTPSPWNNGNQNNSIMSALSSFLPGIGNQNNTEEFKKAKNDFIESQIKDYVKTLNEKFDMQKFLIVINKESRVQNLGKITETDVDWTASTLIRNKVILTKYFIDPQMQKVLSLDIKDILKRQWEGKMAPIIQVLREREETKNILAIDLAVWMVQNRFE